MKYFERPKGEHSCGLTILWKKIMGEREKGMHTMKEHKYL